MLGAVQHSFSGHETFPFRYPWLKKGFDAALEDGRGVSARRCDHHPGRRQKHGPFDSPLVPQRPVCCAENQNGGAALQPTDLGNLLFSDDGLDPYLEDPATLWLLHWQIASSRGRAATWFWIFSYFHEPEFTREALTSALSKWTQTLSGKEIAESSLKARCGGVPSHVRLLTE